MMEIFFFAQVESYQSCVSATQTIRVQNVLQGLRVDITLPPSSITIMISNKRHNLICYAVHLLEDKSNRHHDGMTKEAPDVLKNWMDLEMLCPISDPTDDYSRITFNNNPLHLQLLSSIDNTYPSNSELCFRDR